MYSIDLELYNPSEGCLRRPSSFRFPFYRLLLLSCGTVNVYRIDLVTLKENIFMFARLQVFLQLQLKHEIGKDFGLYVACDFKNSSVQEAINTRHAY